MNSVTLLVAELGSYWVHRSLLPKLTSNQEPMTTMGPDQGARVLLLGKFRRGTRPDCHATNQHLSLSSKCGLDFRITAHLVKQLLWCMWTQPSHSCNLDDCNSLTVSPMATTQPLTSKLIQKGWNNTEHFHASHGVLPKDLESI